MLSRLLNNGGEQRAVSFQSLFALGDGFSMTTNAGTVVTQQDSLKIEAVYSCVRIIADSVSTLPVDTFVRVGAERQAFRPRPMWLDNPESGITRTEHFQQVLVSLLLNGNSFTRIVRDDQGVAALIVLNPEKVECTRNRETRRPEFVYDNRDVIPHEDMIHITELRLPGEMRGRSRIDLIKENLGLAKALEEFAARFFGQGSSASGIIEFPGNLTREQAKDLVNGFEEGHRGLRRSHRPGILFGGAKFTKTTVDNDSAQFLESRRFAIEEIARIFRVPPAMLGHNSAGAMSYASVEMNGINFVTHTLRPYISKIEDGYQKLLTGRAFLKFNVDGLLRGDQASRYAAFSTGIQSGFLSINDIHRIEDMSPVEGGEAYRVPLANVDIGAANLAELDKKSQIAQRLILSGFDPAEVMSALELPTIAHTGVPSTQLQALSTINPADPASVYEVKSQNMDINMPEVILNYTPPAVNVPAPVINVPETVVRVNIPESRPTVRTVERDAEGRILTITERVED
jgi:HK97 family phage portal protein